jgi:hypothetical protein
MWNVSNYLGSMLTDDARCTCEIKCRIAMTKATFNRKKNLFASKLDLNLRKKLAKCYIWSLALYDAVAKGKDRKVFRYACFAVSGT